ncbi:hypothetical protein ACFFMS_13950 [Ectobacillus funiculus]|uniref:Uncharacterized protein n=1 Tax=Ectobacillus funiculus TaxID=137993 RepID=A0ABV5WFY5_9BACI
MYTNITMNCLTDEMKNNVIDVYRSVVETERTRKFLIQITRGSSLFIDSIGKSLLYSLPLLSG